MVPTKNKIDKKKRINISSILSQATKNVPTWERVLRPLSLMVVMGKRNTHIAKQFRVTPQTISKWLQEPEVQQAIEDMTEEVHGRFERQFQVLFGASLKRMNKLIEKSEDGLALEAIKTIWKSHGRYSEKGGDTNINMQQMAMGLSGSDIGRDDATNVLEALRELREQNERIPKVIEGSE